MTVYENYDIIAFKSCIQTFTVYIGWTTYHQTGKQILEKINQHFQPSLVCSEIILHIQIFLATLGQVMILTQS